MATMRRLLKKSVYPVLLPVLNVQQLMLVQNSIVKAKLQECTIILLQDNVKTVYTPVKLVPLSLNVYNVVGILMIEILTQVVVVKPDIIKMDKNASNV